MERGNRSENANLKSGQKSPTETFDQFLERRKREIKRDGWEGGLQPDEKTSNKENQ